MDIEKIVKSLIMLDDKINDIHKENAQHMDRINSKLDRLSDDISKNISELMGIDNAECSEIIWEYITGKIKRVDECWEKLRELKNG